MGDLLNEIAEHVPALRRYARALTRDRDQADDLVQDCLERAIRKKGLWTPKGPLRAWLFRILLNLLRNDMRARRRRPQTMPIENFVGELAAPDSPFERLALVELARAIDRLPDEQREVLLLVAVEGMSYAEAAGILDIPLGTLMSRLGRARAAIRAATYEDGPKLRAVK
ncbi:RNA polymerase subunit sigma [Xaviernesmea oryzae]|uniref:RNA polymerase subunit sigma n=1 Tax=Xaviernesmea oryzae TaxID=464029 RepID=A0A1Q9B1X1_9HYPH|nr:sigma-70 family RNA polymerase sigma factor [Xaviernesmea oryzae]OLP61996.1 RNA polymerase subunit sigma [Xaviernesmea oryzae]SEK97764.1 RNA polymerase sigma-70 factor, ECF subfamily [Xaviernesmea oryzae]